jgi:exonuclease III
MRIATWNMGCFGNAAKRDEAWHWLLDELKPDIALLQECVVPNWARDQCNPLFERALRHWGTAVVTRGLPMVRQPLEDIEAWFGDIHRKDPTRCAATRLKGWCVPALVTLPNGSNVLAISLHNPAYPIDHTLLDGVDVTEIKLTLQPRDVWVLDAVFYFLKNRVHPEHGVRPPLIVGGDFNSSRRLDVPTPRGNNEFFDRIAKEGFVSVHRRFHTEDERTFFGKGEHQLDYLYADCGLASLATNCRVVSRHEVETFSDHSPLVADFVIDAA